MIWIIENLTEEEKKYLKKLEPYHAYSSASSGKRFMTNFEDIKHGFITDAISDMERYFADYVRGSVRNKYNEFDIYAATHDSLGIQISLTLDAVIEHMIINGSTDRLKDINWEQVKILKKQGHDQPSMRNVETLTKAEKLYLRDLSPFCIFTMEPSREDTSISTGFKGAKWDGKKPGKLYMVHFDNLKEGPISDNALRIIDMAKSFFGPDFKDEGIRAHRDSPGSKLIAVSLYAYIQLCAKNEKINMLEAIDWEEVKRLKA